MERLALAAVLGAVLCAPQLRAWLEAPAPPRPCAPEGRGVPPRHWLGCDADPGPARALEGDERLLLGLPLDPNTASAGELAFVPGLTRALAAAIVAHRSEEGPFRTVADLGRVRGIGPRRLSAAAPHLAIAPGVAVGGSLR